MDALVWMEAAPLVMLHEANVSVLVVAEPPTEMAMDDGLMMVDKEAESVTDVKVPAFPNSSAALELDDVVTVVETSEIDDEVSEDENPTPISETATRLPEMLTTDVDARDANMTPWYPVMVTEDSSKLEPLMVPPSEMAALLVPSAVIVTVLYVNVEEAIFPSTLSAIELPAATLTVEEIMTRVNPVSDPAM